MEINENLQLGRVSTKKYGPTDSVQSLNQKIKKYIDSIYGPFGFQYGRNEDININGLILNTEYISKMVNNYTIFKKIIELNRIDNETDFYSFMETNLDEIYNYSGSYFDSVTLPILISTTRKGNVGEKSSLEYMKKVFKDQGIDITIESPTADEDISGIDGKFQWNGRSITIQVKPYDRATRSVSDKVSVYSPGSLSINIVGGNKIVDYLILYKGDKFIIVKGRDVSINGNNFTFQLDKLVSRN